MPSRIRNRLYPNAMLEEESSLEDLSKYTLSQISKTKNLGKKSIGIIEKYLTAAGLSFYDPKKFYASKPEPLENKDIEDIKKFITKELRRHNHNFNVKLKDLADLHLNNLQAAGELSEAVSALLKFEPQLREFFGYKEGEELKKGDVLYDIKRTHWILKTSSKDFYEKEGEAVPW